MPDFTEAELMTRAAWLYHVADLNQQEVSRRLGLTRARVNRLLQQAREHGIVSVSVTARDLGLLPEEDAIRARFGLDFCIATPALGLAQDGSGADPDAALRMVGMAGAGWLRDRLAATPDTVVGVGWGRTLAHLARQLAGVSAPKARFVSLMGSFTANSAVTPFDVVQTLAQATGGAGHVLPVPFIADSEADRRMLLAQHAVQATLALARRADLALISVGDLREDSVLRRTGTLSAQDIDALRRAGAVGDTNGIFFDSDGCPVDHPFNRRTLAVGFDALRAMEGVLLSGGVAKVAATRALLRSGVLRGLVIDGDSARLLASDTAP